MVQTIQSNGFINIASTGPGGAFAFVCDASHVFILSLSHSLPSRGVEVTGEGKNEPLWVCFFVSNVLVRGQQDLGTGSHVLEQGCLMPGV